MTMNEDVNLDSAAKIGHNFTAFAQIVTLDGTVGRDVLALFNQATISGTIDGNLKAKGDSLCISSHAQINGTSKFEGDKPADVASGAKLASPLEYKKLEHKSRTERGLGYYIWRIIWSGAWILFGLVLISLMPKFATETFRSAEMYGGSFGLGVLVLLWHLDCFLLRLCDHRRVVSGHVRFVPVAGHVVQFLHRCGLGRRSSDPGKDR